MRKEERGMLFDGWSYKRLAFVAGPLVITFTLMSPVFFKACQLMSANEKAMNSEAAKVMADRIGKAKRGAILVTFNRELIHVEEAHGGRSGGSITYNTTYGVHETTQLEYLAHRIQVVLNPGDTDYDHFARLYLKGERADSHPPEPPM